MTRIGIDVGGVLTDSLANDDSDTSFRSDNFRLTSAVNGAFESVRHLVSTYGSENVAIISKCGEVIEQKTRIWLAFNDFYAYTKFDPANLYFCLRRPDKAPIAERLQLTHFVDDRRDVLEPMKGVVPHRLLFGPQANPAVPYGMVGVPTWSKVVSYIARTHRQQTKTSS